MGCGWIKFGLCMIVIVVCLIPTIAMAGAQGVSGSFEVDTTPPAAINDLTVGNITGTTITLYWTAPGDDNNVGNASYYDIRYSNIVITNEAEWDAAIQVANETTPQPAGTSEQFTIQGLNIETIYYFVIKTADTFPNWSNLSNSPGAMTIDDVPPAVISDLSIKTFSMNSLTLVWTAPGDNNNLGNATQYDVRYSYTRIKNANDWGNATRLSGEPLPKPPGSLENFMVSGLRPCTTYYFAIKTADKVANWSLLSSNLKTGTGCFDPNMINIVDGNNVSDINNVNDESEEMEPLLFRLDLLGRITFEYLNLDGELQQDMRATSPGGSITLSIREGTKLLDSDGKPLSELRITRISDHPSLPHGFGTVVAYDFEPNQCNFSFPIKMVIKYEKGDVPQGFNPARLVIAHIDDTTGKTVLMPGVVDTFSRTVTFMITGTSAYAILSQAPYAITQPVVVPPPTPEPTIDLQAYTNNDGSGDTSIVDNLGFGLLLGIGVGILVLIAVLVGIGGGILFLGGLLYRRFDWGMPMRAKSKRNRIREDSWYDDEDDIFVD